MIELNESKVYDLKDLNLSQKNKVHEWLKNNSDNWKNTKIEWLEDYIYKDKREGIWYTINEPYIDMHITNALELFDLNHKIINPTEPQDKNVQSVIKSFKERADLGYIKYQTTTERTDIDLLGWLNHLQEELMDATIYIERLKQEIK